MAPAWVVGVVATAGHGRNLILLSDGTGNSAGKLFKTNVWRFYQALDLSGPAQVAFYDDGVGTSSFKPLAILGGAFGWGLKRNVIALYCFLSRNYLSDDRIFGYGFSRGAFTIRVLLRFVLSEGLVNDFHSEDDLRRKARKLYRDFRRKQSTRRCPSERIRALAYACLRPFEPVVEDRLPVPRVAFVGVWDTVDAYGMPIREIKLGIDRYLWPLTLNDQSLHPGIAKACHALAIDDRRKTFHPLLWDEMDRGAPAVPQHTDEERLTQVWFCGAHANVGGGYPDDSLSYVALAWMIDESRKQGVAFRRQPVEEISAAASAFGRLYDSRAGFGAYYRYDPRVVGADEVQAASIDRPKIHESVIWRMAVGTDAYSPPNLPSSPRIVRGPASNPDGTGTQLSHQAGMIYDLASYQDAIRSGQIAFGSQAANQRMADDLSALKLPDDQSLRLVWDTIWWRKVAYFSTLAVTILLVLFPYLPSPDRGHTADLLLNYPAAEISYRIIRSIANVLRPVLDFGIEAVASFLPGVVKPALEAYRGAPWPLASLALAVVTLLYWGSLVDRRIQDRALAAWNAKWRSRRTGWLRAGARLRIAGAVALAVVAGVSIFSTFRLAQYLKPQLYQQIGEDITLEDASVRAAIFALGVAATASAALLLALACYLVWLTRFSRRVAESEDELPGLALRLARLLRGSHAVRMASGFIARTVLPGLIAACIVAATLAGLNNLAFELFDRGGWTCRESNPRHMTEFDHPMEGVVFYLRPDGGCTSPGIRLYAGKNYLLTFDERRSSPRPTNDRRLPQPSAGLRELTSLAWRFWNQNLGAPIAQVGTNTSRQYFHEQLLSHIVVRPKQTGELFVFINGGMLRAPTGLQAFERWTAPAVRVSLKIISAADVEAIEAGAW